MKNWKPVASRILWLITAVLILSLPAKIVSARTLNVTTRTEDEIRQFIWDHPAEYISASDAYKTAPNLEAPYSPGSLTTAALQAGLNAVNQIRFTAGLTANIVTDSSYNEKCQAGMLVNAVNGQMTHYPGQPEGMSDELYQLGYSGTSSSNIAWGYGSLAYAVFGGWVHDGDSSNIDRVGHRRWLLHPGMQKTGFGQVASHTAMYAFDGFYNDTVEAEVAWPAQKMPVNWMDSNLPWSVTFGKTLDSSAIVVKMTRKSDGASWTFSEASADGPFYVNNQGYGQLGCVIFRPEGITYKTGDHFDVSITGAASETVTYSVDLFNLGLQNAVSGKTASGKSWSIAKDGTLTISGSGSWTQSDSDELEAYENDIVKVIVKEGITSIGSLGMYYLSKIDTVQLPYSLTSIGSYAFYYSKLSQIYYCGTSSEWKAVSGGSNLVENSGCTVTCIGRIVTQPKNTSVQIGQKAKLTVSATGPNLQYQWYYRKSSSDKWSASTTASGKTSTYTCTGKESYSGRQFRCKVTSKYGSTYTKIVTLTVTPKITTQPKAVSVPIGDKVKFTTAAEGTDLSYQWYYRKSSSDGWIASTSASGKTSTYTCTGKESYSGRQFRCKVTSKYGSSYTNTVTLTVTPKITVQPAKASVPVGDKAKFTVEAEGTSLTYQWYYRDSSSDKWKTSTTESGKSNAYSFTAKESYSGREFRCKVTSKYGSTYTDIVSLTVIPKITTQPKNVTAISGKTVKFTVEAAGTDLQYQWYYRGSSSEKWTASTTASGKSSAYSFTAKESKNGYQYRCKVTGLYGSCYTKTVILTVQ